MTQRLKRVPSSVTSNVTGTKFVYPIRRWLLLNSKNAENGLVFSWRPVLPSFLGRTNSEPAAMTSGTPGEYLLKSAFDASSEKLKIEKRDFIRKTNDIDKEIRQSTKYLDFHKRSARAAVENSDRIFTEIIRSIQNKQAEVRKKIKAQKNKEVRDVENHIQRLEKEIVKLQKDKCKLKPLLQTEDHVYFFQNYASCSTFTQRKVSPRKINDIQTFENVEKSVSHLKKQLDKLCEEQMGKISKTVADVQIFKNRFQSNQDYHLLLKEMDSNTVDSEVTDTNWAKKERSAQAAVENSDRIFTEIIRSIQNIRAEVRKKTRAQENKELRDAESHIQLLRQEIVKLQKETCKLEPLLHTEDHVYFFQNYASCSTFTQRTASPRKINDIHTFENVEKSVSNLKIQLDKLCEEHMGRISKTVADVQIFKNRIQSSFLEPDFPEVPTDDSVEDTESEVEVEVGVEFESESESDME
ncbi:unnamed protein product [Leuciscus chuanchicus]